MIAYRQIQVAIAIIPIDMIATAAGVYCLSLVNNKELELRSFSYDLVHNAKIKVRGNQAKQNMLVSYHSEHSDKQKDKIGDMVPNNENN